MGLFGFFIKCRCGYGLEKGYEKCKRKFRVSKFRKIRWCFIVDCNLFYRDLVSRK